VTIINYPKIIELNGCTAFVDDMPVYEPKRILDFGKWIRIIKYNGGVLTVGRQSFSVIKSGVTSQGAQEILKYLKDISQYTSDDPKEDAFLKKEMEQITFVHPESVLSSFVTFYFLEKLTPHCLKDSKIGNRLFPALVREYSTFGGISV